MPGEVSNLISVVDVIGEHRGVPRVIPAALARPVSPSGTVEVKLIDLPISEARAIKWQRGREKYGAEFQGDPLEELDAELLDAMNYAEEAQRQGVDMGWIPSRLLGLCEVVREIRREHCTRVQKVSDGD
jgi:hypothetical protein